MALDFVAMTATRYTRKLLGAEGFAGFYVEHAVLDKDENDTWRMGDLGQREILESFRRSGK